MWCIWPASKQMMMSNCLLSFKAYQVTEISECTLDVDMLRENDTNSRASRQIVWKCVVCLCIAVSQAWETAPGLEQSLVLHNPDAQLLFVERLSRAQLWQVSLFLVTGPHRKTVIHATAHSWMSKQAMRNKVSAAYDKWIINWLLNICECHTI